jgi:hypothetical protein
MTRRSRTKAHATTTPGDAMKNSRLVTVLLAGLLLVGAANLGAFAATGGPLLLGKGNSATKTTKLKTTGNGAALSLKSKKTAPPLKVSNSTKVAKFNADLVDGLDSPALRNRTYVYDIAIGGVTNNFVEFALPGLPPGKYVTSMVIVGNVDGGTPFLGCFVASGTGVNLQVAAIANGIDGGGDNYFVSGSGYVDTTSATHRLLCQKNGSTEITIPAAPSLPSYVAFTRVDDVSRSATLGNGTALNRAPLG